LASSVQATKKPIAGQFFERDRKADQLEGLLNLFYGGFLKIVEISFKKSLEQYLY